jgi:hypothetical protein
MTLLIIHRQIMILAGDSSAQDPRSYEAKNERNYLARAKAIRLR